MPSFTDPFNVKQSDRKLTNEELIRSIRFSIAAEYEAIQFYIQLAESTDDELTQKVMRDIADEEIVHAGEFLRLLEYLNPEEKRLYDEGYREVQEMVEEMKRREEE